MSVHPSPVMQRNSKSIATPKLLKFWCDVKTNPSISTSQNKCIPTIAKTKSDSMSSKPILTNENNDKCSVLTRIVKFLDFFTKRRIRPTRKSRKMDTLMDEDVENRPAKLPATMRRSRTFHVTLKNSRGLTAKNLSVISTKNIQEKMASSIKVPLS